MNITTQTLRKIGRDYWIEIPEHIAKEQDIKPGDLVKITILDICR